LLIMFRAVTMSVAKSPGMVVVPSMILGYLGHSIARLYELFNASTDSHPGAVRAGPKIGR
jgi:hypothetical protein